jgi:hypothetical protein
MLLLLHERGDTLALLRREPAFPTFQWPESGTVGVDSPKARLDLGFAGRPRAGRLVIGENGEVQWETAAEDMLLLGRRSFTTRNRSSPPLALDK